MKVGDIVQYIAFKRRAEWAKKHHSCIGVVRRLYEESGTEFADVGWVTHNFTYSDVEGDYEKGWATKGLRVIGHITESTEGEDV